MIKRFSILVMANLLLAASIGSAEAKKIDTTYDAGEGVIQLATSPNPGLSHDLAANTGLPLDGSNADVKWLLAYYYEVGSQLPDQDASGELPASEGYEDSSGEDVWFGYNLAGLVYGDPLMQNVATTPISTSQPTTASSPTETTVSGSPAEEGSDNNYETSFPPELYDPPVVIRVNEPIPPENSPPATAPATDPAPQPSKKSPQVKPDAGPVPIQPEDTSALAGPPDTTTASPVYIQDSQLGKLPEVKAPDAGSVPGELDDKPPTLVSLPDKTKQPQYDERAGSKVAVPDVTANSPSPVPEPATMLLFSAGLAGLAFGRPKRNKCTRAGSSR